MRIDYAHAHDDAVARRDLTMQNGKHYTFGNLHDWRTDPDKCANGVPFEIGLGRALIVRRANIYDRAVQAQFESIARDDDKAMQAVFARIIVLDWRGIVDDAGDPVPYSPEACIALLEYANELWHDLQRFALNRANYAYTRNQEDSDALKTSRDGEPVPAPTANS